MALSATALLEVSKLSPDLHPVVELTLPGGVKRYAGVGFPVSSDSLGTYDGKVTAWSDIVHSSSDANGALIPIQTTVELIDNDSSLEAVLTGSSWKTIRGSAATIRLASSGIPLPAEWPVRFAGQIADYDKVRPRVWRLVLRSADNALRGTNIPTDVIKQTDFPNIGDVKTYGVPIPIIYGLFDSRDGTGVSQGPIGAMPAYYVNNVAGAYYALCGIGYLFHIERVFLAGVAVSSSLWYATTLLMPGFQTAQPYAPYYGRRMTFIKFTNDPGQVAITWDGYGLPNSGLGLVGGPENAPLTNPVDQLRNLLNNFLLPDTPWRNGLWATSDNALLDTTSWNAARTWMETSGYRGSCWLGGSFIDGLTAINDFATSWGFEFYWTLAGKLGLKPRDPSSATAAASIYPTAWLNSHEPNDNPISPTGQQEEATTELIGESFTLPSQNQARTTLYVGDYGQAKLSKYMTSKTGTSSRTASRRRWQATYARYLRELLDNPTGVYFADDISGDVYNASVLTSWNDIKTFGAIYNMGMTNSPPLKIGAVAGRPSVVFDGVSMMGSITALSNLVSANKFTIFTVLKATAAGGAAADALAYNNPCVWGDSAGKMGLAQQLSGGQNYLQLYVNDGAMKVVKLPISLNTWYVVTAGTLRGSINLCVTQFDQPATLACGNIAALTGTMSVGTNFFGGAFWAGEIYSLIIQNAEDLGAQGGSVGYFGGGLYFYTIMHLADLIRLPEASWLG